MEAPSLPSAPTSRLETLEDASGNLTTFEYDGHDRQEKLRYPDASNGSVSSTTDFETFAYDENGNVTTHTLRSGADVVLTYDALNRVTFRNYPGTTPDVTLDYDAAGRRTAADVSGYAVSHGYDALGRLEESTADGRTVEYDYDATGNLTLITWPAVGGSAAALPIAYAYDALNRVTAVLDDTSTLAAFTYDELSRRESITAGRAGGITSQIPGDGCGQQLHFVH